MIIVGFLVFFSVLFIYNAARSFPENTYLLPGFQASPRDRWILQHRRILRYLSFIAFCGVLITAIFVNWKVWACFLFGSLVVFLYYSPSKKLRFKGLRKTRGLKVFVIAFVWALVTLGAPLLDRPDYQYSSHHVWLLLQRFLFIVAITIPFDIRDLQKDLKSRVFTLPQKLGIRNTRILIAVLLFFLLILDWYIFQWPGVLPYWLALAYPFILLLYLNSKKGDLYFSFLWDGAIMVQSLLILFYRI